MPWGESHRSTTGSDPQGERSNGLCPRVFFKNSEIRLFRPGQRLDDQGWALRRPGRAGACGGKRPAFLLQARGDRLGLRRQRYRTPAVPLHPPARPLVTLKDLMNTHTNFDAAELDKFQALAARWWDPESEFRPLHAINPHRLAWIDALVGLQGKKALDVGCGGGILAESMARRGAEVLGIDLADKALKVATLHAQKSNATVSYRYIAAETLAPEQADAFDVVTCMETLEHVPDPSQVVAACAHMVKPGGWVFFSTINRSALGWLIAIVGAERILKVLPRGTHDYAKFIRPSELKAMAGAAGLTLRQERGLGYNPLTKRFHLYRFMGVGYLLAMQKV